MCKICEALSIDTELPRRKISFSALIRFLRPYSVYFSPSGVLISNFNALVAVAYSRCIAVRDSAQRGTTKALQLRRFIFLAIFLRDASNKTEAAVQHFGRPIYEHFLSEPQLSHPGLSFPFFSYLFPNLTFYKSDYFLPSVVPSGSAASFAICMGSRCSLLKHIDFDRY